MDLNQRARALDISSLAGIPTLGAHIDGPVRCLIGTFCFSLLFLQCRRQEGDGYGSCPKRNLSFLCSHN